MTERRKDHNVIIDRLDLICERLDNVETAIKSLQPVSDGLITFQNIIKLFKFLGIPTTIVIGFVYWLISIK